jgi:Fe2+ transport system protein B
LTITRRANLAIDINTASIDNPQFWTDTIKAIIILIELPAYRIARNYAFLKNVEDVSCFADKAGSIFIIDITVIWF